jgi:3-hydroxyisobutyrate dehydrogenase/2-hydroxy-3-oxopropionate reductase
MTARNARSIGLSAQPNVVGFVGLGRMGAPMAGNLSRAGFDVRLYNRTRERAESLAREIGAVVADRPADVAASADVIVTMLADGPAVESVYCDGGGIVDGVRPGAIAVEMSTIGPAVVDRLAAALARAGAHLVDAPVSGSVALARDRQLTVMAGGTSEDFERVRRVLEAMGSRVFHVGPVGSGATIKLAVNAVIYGLCEALAEGLVLAERAGIERTIAYEIFASSAAAAPFVHYRRHEFERPGEAPVAFRLALAKKDLDLILELSERVHAPMPQAATNIGVLEAAMSGGFSDDDVAAVAEFLRRGARSS